MSRRGSATERRARRQDEPAARTGLEWRQLAITPGTTTLFIRQSPAGRVRCGRRL
jgi:hypothetical protein